MGLDEAIEEAGETRFVPIILTTLTAIGGLLSSTILTRIVTPVLYKLLAPRISLQAPDTPDASAPGSGAPAPFVAMPAG
jgi:multidrug efflux pump subunit AcrB